MTRQASKSCQLPRIYLQDEYRGTDMREIVLTQNKIALVDDEDFEKLNRFKWYAKKDKNTFYAGRALFRANGRQYTISMHHQISGKPSKGFVNDHRDGNGLNNQRNNLRFVTYRQNGQNLRNIIKTSQYPGVSWYKRTKKWEAYIKINGIKKHLGHFTNEKKAFEVYRQAVSNIGENPLTSD